jgi:HK97 family phage major capsid protein
MTPDQIKKLHEERLRTWEQAKALNEAVVAEGRDFSAEEQQTWDKANARMSEIDARVGELRSAEEARAASEAAFAEMLAKPQERDAKPADEVRDFFSGKLGKSKEFRSEGPVDFRALSKLTAGAGANTVKTSFYERLVAHLIEVSGIMAAGPTVLQTTTGEQIQVPKTTAHSTAALIAEAGTITASDPTFGQVPLDSYKYAFLLQVSNELLTDASVDLEGYLAMQAGRALGNAFGTHAITGTGSSQPNGLVTAATLGKTGSASVSGAFSGDDLIDLKYSVIEPYRRSPSCVWMMKDATIAAVRKLKASTSGDYYWQPSLIAGEPDMLLGHKVVTDPNIAAVALSAKSVVFGDVSQYFVRLVNGIRFERSDDYAFNTDLVTYRAILRADGDLVDTTGAVKYFAGNAA